MKNIKIIGCGEGVSAVSYIKNRCIPDAVCIAAAPTAGELAGIDADIKLEYGEIIGAADFSRAAGLAENDIIFVVGDCRPLPIIAPGHMYNIACCYCFIPFLFEGRQKYKTAALQYDLLKSSGFNVVKIDSDEVMRKVSKAMGAHTTFAQMNEAVYDYICRDILKRTAE